MQRRPKVVPKSQKWSNLRNAARAQKVTKSQFTTDPKLPPGQFPQSFSTRGWNARRVRNPLRVMSMQRLTCQPRKPTGSLWPQAAMKPWSSPALKCHLLSLSSKTFTWPRAPKLTNLQLLINHLNHLTQTWIAHPVGKAGLFHMENI